METIFCVDDDQTLVEIMGARLSFKGFDTKEFSEADEAVLAAEKNMPDLIFLDKNIDSSHGSDGMDICAKIRTMPAGKNVKVIILSGLINDDDRRKGDICGVDAYLDKPFESGELFELIDKLLHP